MSKRDSLLAIDYVKGATSGGTSRVVGGGGGTFDTSGFLLLDGSRAMTGNLDMGGFNVINVNLLDGVDLAAHVANANAHHARQHSYDSTSDHTGTLSWSNVNKSGSNLTDIVTRTHNSLQSIGENDHHNRSHSITSASDHTVTGSAFDLVGLNATNTLAILTPSANVQSGIERILKSTSTGNLGLASLTTSLIDSTGGSNLTLQPSNYLTLSPGGYLVRLTGGVALQSDDYSSQTTGMRIDQLGNGDFRYLFVDEMHAKSFIVDLEQALAGGQIISKSVAILYQDFIAPAAGAPTTLVVRDLPGTTSMAAFVNGDVVRLRNFSRAGGSLSITDCWGTVVLDTTYGTSGFDSNTKTQRYIFTRSSGSDAGAMATSTVVSADTLVLDYGVSGNGYYEVNAIDGSYGINSPYSQTVIWTGHPATGRLTTTRLGNLNGIFSTSGEYGLYAGTGTTDASSYLRVSNTQVGIYNVPLRMFTGSTETVHIGGWNDFWIGPSSADKRISWNGSTLSITGVVTIQAGSAGYGNLSGIPTSLADVNPTEGSKLTGIATGATKNTLYRQATDPGGSNGDFWYDTDANPPVLYQKVSGSWQVASNYVTNTNQVTDGAELGKKATWSTTYLTGLPARFSFESTPTGQAAQLFLAANAMGYWDGFNWRTYFDNTGQMVLRGSSGAYVCWNGTTMFGGTSTSSATAKWYVDSTNGYLVAGNGTVALMNYGFLINNSDLSGGGSWPFVSGGLHSVSDVISPSTGYRGSLLFGVPTGVWALSPTAWHFHYPGNLPQSTPSPTGGSSWDTAIAISDDTETNFVWHSGNDGGGSGLDADTLDTYHATSFALLSGATFTGIVYGAVSASGTGGSPLRFPTTGALATSTNNDTFVFYHIADNEFGMSFYDSAAYRTIHLQPLGGAVHIGGGASTVLRVGNTSDLYSAKIQTNGNIHAEGAITSESYLQLSTEAAPAASAGWGRIWFDGTNLRLTTSAGTYTINKS